MRTKPIVLVVLDGWGVNPSKRGNAIKLANTPNYDFYWNNYPRTKLKAFVEAVGLAQNTIGGSEVGHIHIGAGRVEEQELKIINDAIRDKSFFRNKALLKAIKHAKKNNSALHLIGLLSDGGVHSDYRHLFAILKLCKQHGLGRVYIHAFLDGRDVFPGSAPKYLKELQRQINNVGVGELASVIGRAYAMDRSDKWDRTKLAYELLVEGKGKNKTVEHYLKNFTDRFVPPVVVSKHI